MSIFIANANGDWWQYIPGQALWILNTEDLSEQDRAELAETWGDLDGSEDYPDKLEKAIWKYGHAVFFEDNELTRWTTE